MTWFALYLFVVADQLRDALSNYGSVYLTAVLMTIVITVVTIVIRCSLELDHRGDPEAFEERWTKTYNTGLVKVFRRLIKWLWIIPTIMFFLHAVIPTQKNLAILIGAGVVYETVTSETGKRIGGKTIELLEQKLDEVISNKEDAGGEETEKAPAHAT